MVLADLSVFASLVDVLHAEPHCKVLAEIVPAVEKVVLGDIGRVVEVVFVVVHLDEPVLCVCKYLGTNFFANFNWRVDVAFDIAVRTSHKVEREFVGLAWLLVFDIYLTCHCIVTVYHSGSSL